ncbi:hypothetical protein [Paenibacillus sp. JDR-2]|uniref:hypothetical protein n=1 Tax=Paenibacillus sp. (strain JDR-2) TaxID=324057 RepID=UPI000166A4ED|nr:hypothetical protein [Paenibacillus sp. JDR-2]ACT00595.1 hypothetical protein Pjdr2_1938 [Paenibacillus sp. JDR-2]
MSHGKKARISLSPPEITYYNEIKYSVGKDPLVKVGRLEDHGDGQFEVKLLVKGIKKAKALATLMASDKVIGEIGIHVKVISSGRAISPIARALTAKEIAGLYRIAFRTNRIFQFVALRSIFGSTYVYPVFRIKVVQFYNDDLSDFYGNYNNVAAFVFRNVLLNEIDGVHIQFSTAKKRRSRKK